MKNKRHEKILEIIKRDSICTQDDLQNALNKYGFNVTQSTVSRDIRELKLVKSRNTSGNYCYSASEQRTEQLNLNHKQIISSSVKNVDFAMNDVVIKCYSGMAQSVCVCLDNAFQNLMLGSIAGDDTIFIITHTADDAKILCEEIKKLM